MAAATETSASPRGFRVLRTEEELRAALVRAARFDLAVSERLRHRAGRYASLLQPEPEALPAPVPLPVATAPRAPAS